MTYKYQAHARISGASNATTVFHATLYRYTYKSQNITKKPVVVHSAYYPEDTFTAPGVDVNPLWDEWEHKGSPSQDIPLFDSLDEAIAYIQQTWEELSADIISSIQEGLPAAKNGVIQRFI